MRHHGRVPLDPALRARLRSAASKQVHWLNMRDGLIVEAYAAGATQREIGELVGLSHVAVGKILKRRSVD